jgi:flagellar biosynthesis/type III secretory pathway chaperone
MAIVAAASGLTEQLHQEFECYCALEGLLVKEEAALIDVASDRVAALAGEKERVTIRLQELAHRRVTMLRSQGLSGDAAGMQTWLARHPEQAEAAPAWAQLSSKVETTKRQNQTNGRLIDALVRHLQARLNMISSATCANPTYGADGLSKVTRFPSVFGQA